MDTHLGQDSDSQMVTVAHSSPDASQLPGGGVHSFDALHDAQQSLTSKRAVVQRANELLEGRRINASKSRAMVYQQESAKIPTNDFGLPTYVYRADIIPVDLDTYSPTQKTAILQAASISISYEGGTPTLDTGALLWNKFNWEPATAYEMFQRFIDMPSLEAQVHGAGGRIDLSASNRTNIQISVRDLSTLAELYPNSSAESTREEYISKIREMSILYCWHARVKAYDLFIAAAYRKWREQKVYSVEQDHFRKAEVLMQRSNVLLEDMLMDPDKAAGLKPKDLLDILTKMMAVQRVSIGLSAMTSTGGKGSGNEDGSPQNASLEVTLRSIAKNAGEESKAYQNDDRVSDLLADPDMLYKAQEIIIKMNQR